MQATRVRWAHARPTPAPAYGVEQPGDGEQEQDAVEDPQAQLAARLALGEAGDHAVDRIEEQEGAGHREQEANHDVERRLHRSDLRPRAVYVER